MKTAVVVSPYRASATRSLTEHEAHAKVLCALLARAGWAVYAGHLSCTQFLDEQSEIDRRIGIETNLAWIERSDRLCIWDPWGISSGMTREIDHAFGTNADRRVQRQAVVEATAMYPLLAQTFKEIQIDYFARGAVPEWNSLRESR